MKLGDILVKEAVIYELEGTTKDDVIDELMAVMKKAKAFPPGKAEIIRDEVFKREKLGTTGIGNSGAVPHAKVQGLKKISCAFGRIGSGLDWQSVDGEPVSAVFLLISPKDDVQPHLAAIKRISELIQHEHFTTFVKQTGNTEELLDLLAEVDEGSFI